MDVRPRLCPYALAHRRVHIAAIHTHTRIAGRGIHARVYLQIGRFVSSIVDTLYSRPTSRPVSIPWRLYHEMDFFFQNRESVSLPPLAPDRPLVPVACPSLPQVPFGRCRCPFLLAATAADSLTVVASPDKNVSNSSNRPRLVSVSIV